MSQHDLCAWWSQQILQVLPNQLFTNWSYGNLKSLQVCMHAHFYLALSPSYLPHTVSPSFSLLGLSPPTPHTLSLSLSPSVTLSLSLSFSLPLSLPLSYIMSPPLSLSPSFTCCHPIRLCLSPSHTLSLSPSPFSPFLVQEKQQSRRTHHWILADHTCKQKKKKGIMGLVHVHVITNNTCSVRMPIGHNKQHIIFNIHTVHCISQKQTTQLQCMLTSWTWSTLSASSIKSKHIFNAC